MMFYVLVAICVVIGIVLIKVTHMWFKHRYPLDDKNKPEGSGYVTPNP